ncbi:MAG: MBL fold metallo-hydrolase, partial [Acidobacteriota bacterium]
VDALSVSNPYSTGTGSHSMVRCNFLRFKVLFSLLCLCSIGSLSAGENDRLIKLDDSVYARIVSPNGNAVGNSGFVILENWVVVFDTHFTPEEGQQLKDAIKTVTPLPVLCVINSHYHPDHTHGNQVFKNAFVIGSKGTREDVLQKDLPSLERSILVTSTQLERMREDLSKLKDPEKIESTRDQVRTRESYLQTLQKLDIKEPLVAMKDYLAIRVGLDEAQILCIGSGHTENDAILYVPSKKIVFCGGLFFNTAIPNVQDANILTWMKTLMRMLEMDADIFVPGHGPPGNRRKVQDFLEYFYSLRALVEPFVNSGKSLELAMQEVQLPEKYRSYRFKNLFPSNIQKMYEELKAELLLSIPIEGPQLPKK